jgi:beta-mannosidase
MYSKTIKLLFVWLLLLHSDFLQAQSISQSLNSERVNWTFYDAAKQKYFAANVPGTIHTDLLSNNLIPDPLTPIKFLRH